MFIGDPNKKREHRDWNSDSWMMRPTSPKTGLWLDAILIAVVIGLLLFAITGNGGIWAR